MFCRIIYYQNSYLCSFWTLYIYRLLIHWTKCDEKKKNIIYGSLNQVKRKMIFFFVLTKNHVEICNKKRWKQPSNICPDKFDSKVSMAVAQRKQINSLQYIQCMLSLCRDIRAMWIEFYFYFYFCLIFWYWSWGQNKMTDFCSKKKKLIKIQWNQFVFTPCCL